ncbi:hypothetical protein ARAM_004655 [Aspergillus rambellii]|uniref:chitinase n=2 Tax=Aspergillus subgen. Nidulantes TaxID=2720870 RepID=A0A0F8WB10_9EURO|nr:hypothetical protein ARAM_004655 [Aspergillus rambellii]KKK23850.1 hypothetical protein AOCH_005796 [Aspergillus ochraceoroseus]
MDLLWRNNINSDQVTLGIAFYARAFTVADPSCQTAGCAFASGSRSGNCSMQTGVLLNSEFDEIRKVYGVKPTLDKEAAVEVLTWDKDQWATYDDATTFKLKIDFAKRFCLGGIMAHSPSIKRSPIIKSLVTYHDQTVTVVEKAESKQCRWTGCGALCPSDLVTVYRSDPGARHGELMLDGTGCPDDSVRTLCCPPYHAVECGWYTHHNGKCDQTCPRSKDWIFAGLTNYKDLWEGESDQDPARILVLSNLETLEAAAGHIVKLDPTIFENCVAW